MATISLLPNNKNLPTQLTIPDHPTYQGGEGNVYFSPDGRYVVKMYHTSPPLPPDKRESLQKIINLGTNFGDAEQFLVWPLAVVDQLNSQPRLGVVTRRVPASHVALYKLMYSPVDAVKQFEQGWSWLEYLKSARGTAAALRFVHGSGMAHADVHMKNFLVNSTTGEIVLIDLDGLVVKGELRSHVLGMMGFIAPEVLMGKGHPDELTDRYSLAVLILWILLLRNVMQTRGCYDDEDPRRDDILGYGQYACFSENPHDRRNWTPGIGMPLFRNGVLSYRSLTPKLQKLTEQALILGLHDPQKRPYAIEWERALAEAYDVMVPCLNCRQSFFYQHWLQPPGRRQCPFCGSGVRMPFPIVLELKEAAAKGVYNTIRSVVFYHGLPLFSDLIERGQRPPFSRKAAKTPIMGQIVWVSGEGVYRLFNGSDTPWQILKGASGTVGRGASVALKPGLLLSFGTGKRLAQVVE